LAAFGLADRALAEPVRVGHVQAELISELTAITPGQPFTVGLRLQMDEHWHVYWRNPGDAGLAPKLTWNLPAGFTAGEIQWPYPEQFKVPPLTSYGFHREVLLPLTITPPTDLPSGTQVVLSATADWLVCREACIPGKADLMLTLPVVATTPSIDAEWADVFNEARRKQPLAGSDWTLSGDVDGGQIRIDLQPPSWYADSLDSILFLPYDAQVIDYDAPQILTRTDNGYRLTIRRSDYSVKTPERITGILMSETGWRGPESEKALVVDVQSGGAATAAAQAAATSSGSIGLLEALLLAFLGGMILNLMPCVLPVLSLKILGFVNQAKEGRRVAIEHGLVFTLGVLVSFWILAGALLGLRAGGEQLGWGFQLQSPTFVVVLASFMFLFGLNLLGVFEVGASLTGVGQQKRRSGLGGSFLNGVTATVVATPCTAPFMGSALGFSLSQPAAASLLIFTFLGLGMAAPYVVLSASPALLRFVPKPGRWMETLKQVMGFLLLATVIWLAWVLGVQAGSNAVAALLGALLVLGIGGWVLGRWGGLAVSPSRRRAINLVAMVLILGGITLGLAGVKTLGSTPSAATVSDGAIAWEPFTNDRLDSARREGRPVFIDFTAAWCLSCQVNERVAFSSSDVQRRFSDLGIQALKADWTSRSEEITQALAGYGRNSVPLYVLYGAGNKPTILPEILTPGIVLKALNEIDG